MTEKIKPSVTVDLWTEKPDAAEALMNSDSQKASDWGNAGWWLGGSVLLTMLINQVIRRGAGPFGSLVDVVMQVFRKPVKQPDNKPERQETNNS